MDLARLLVAAVALAVALPLPAAAASPAPRSAPGYREGELLVRFKAGAPASARERLHRLHGSTTARRFRDPRLEQVTLRKGLSVPGAIALYRADPSVDFAEPNSELRLLALPNDPYLPQQWNLRNLGQAGGTPGADIGAEAAWDLTTGSGDVVVALLDTGVDYTHPDLAPNVWVNSGEIPGNGVDDDGDGYADDVFGIDATSGASDPMDENGHGTHVAGIVGAVGDDGRGVVGVSWRVKMMACKVLDASGAGSIASAVACLDYVKARKDAGVNVVATNNSYGCRGAACESQALRDAIDAQRDILFVAAAGNDSADDDREPLYPASYDAPNVLAVAATNRKDALPQWSAFGRHSVHLAAPGDLIVSTLPVGMVGIADGYGDSSGTSMAAPHVAGVAALVKSRFPGADWREVRNRILAGAARVPPLAWHTIAGRVDARGALACAGRPTFSVLHYPQMLTAGTPITLSALSIDCERPVGPVVATIASGGTLELRDDGVAPDLAEGDGIFTASFTPTRDAEQLAFSSPAGTETIAIPVPVGAIQIDPGTGYVYSTSVTLQLWCEDAYGGGCVSMQLGGDGTTWSAPEPFAEVRGWTLPPGDGKKAVWVRYLNAVGNASFPHVAEVLYSSRKPDLVTRDARASDAAVGGSFTVSAVSANLGKGTAGPTFTALKLVKRGPGAVEILVGGRDVPELAPGARVAWTAAWEVPPGTPAGDYDLVLIADDGNAIPETDERNNVVTTRIRVRR